MKYKLLITLIVISSLSSFGQGKFIGIGSGFNGSSVSPVLGVFKDFSLGKKDKFIIGTGVRYTGFFGNHIYFTSAPASLAADLSKTDSLVAHKPSLQAVNLMINLGYRLGSKIQVGFNIDLVGVSFGPEGTPNFVSNGSNIPVKAKPTSTNVLLVGNNDRGSLNSLFYASYDFTKKISANLGFQYLFNELTTASKIQTSPEPNDRFRAKSTQGYVGLQIKF